MYMYTKTWLKVNQSLGISFYEAHTPNISLSVQQTTHQNKSLDTSVIPICECNVQAIGELNVAESFMKVRVSANTLL